MKNVIIGVLSVLIILTGGYIVYDKVLMNDNLDNEVEIDSVQKENSNLLDETKLEDYKNSDGTYGT